MILVIKYRHKFLTPEMLERMETITREVLNKWGVTLVEFNGEADHVHWLIDAHPALDLSRMIGNVKTVTARHLRKEYAGLLFNTIVVIYSGKSMNNALFSLLLGEVRGKWLAAEE